MNNIEALQSLMRELAQVEDMKDEDMGSDIRYQQLKRALEIMPQEKSAKQICKEIMQYHGNESKVYYHEKAREFRVVTRFDNQKREWALANILPSGVWISDTLQPKFMIMIGMFYYRLKNKK